MRPPNPLVPTRVFDVVPTAVGYDRWADFYDGEDNALITLEEQHLPALMGDVAGQTLADVGCGTGRHALRWATAGADVTALDLSEGMLARARAKAGADAVRWIHHDAAQALPLADQSCDGVVSALVLEHVRDLAFFFAELGRICRPAGRIVLSAMHPAMLLRGIEAHFKDPATGREVHPEGHAHSIADFLMAALQAGLTLDHISEHAIDDALAARSARLAKHAGWPLLLLLRFRRRP